MITQLFSRISALPQVEAIALGGSRAGANFDESSDYDIYLYCTAPIPEEQRRQILGPYCSYVEYGNHFWELEDNGTLNNGIDFDLLFRDLDDFTADVARVVEQHQPSNAYTTCMWHNLLTCQIIYDRDGRLAAVKRRFSVPYPEPLRHNIIQQGWRLLSDSMPAYRTQILKASKRGDMVSVNHRTAAFLETYFDVILAINRQTHPGEKRLVAFCMQHCPILPVNFQKNLDKLFSDMFCDPSNLAADLDAILDALKKNIVMT